RKFWFKVVYLHLHLPAFVGCTCWAGGLGECIKCVALPRIMQLTREGLMVPYWSGRMMQKSFSPSCQKQSMYRFWPPTSTSIFVPSLGARSMGCHVLDLASSLMRSEAFRRTGPSAIL